MGRYKFMSDEEAKQEFFMFALTLLNYKFLSSRDLSLQAYKGKYLKFIFDEDGSVIFF